MGLINWFKENQKQKAEKRKRYLESLPKCRYCKEAYLEELVGPNDIYHKKGFCCQFCLLWFVADKVIELEKRIK